MKLKLIAMLTIIMCISCSYGRDNFESIFKLNQSMNDKNIVVAGVFGKDSAGNFSLFFNLESQQNKISKNSVFLLPVEGMKFTENHIGKYVLIRGVYSNESPRNLHSGLIAVTRVSESMWVK